LGSGDSANAVVNGILEPDRTGAIIMFASSWISVAASFFCVSFAAAASAAVIFDNGPPPPTIGTVADSDFARPAQWADDFILSDALGTTVTDVLWWGTYVRESLGDPQPTDDFTVRIFASAGGSPPKPQDTPIYETHLGAVSRIDSGINIFINANVYEYVASIPPVTLSADTRYWISTVNDTTLTNYWQWPMVNTSSTTGNSAVRTSDANSWLSVTPFYESAFRLTGHAAIPEPATCAMVATAFVLLARCRHDRAVRQS
jgi:hypothetical protein